MNKLVVLVVYAAINRAWKPETQTRKITRLAGIVELRGFFLCPIAMGTIGTKSKKLFEFSTSKPRKSNARVLLPSGGAENENQKATF
ncbi:Uncharacterised protein [Candidatus Bartonella washoeensis]|uniref:Uncharacterized protein n=1 Tax=Candidatus Bartonella washoeensis Sb944nv TaxID=1094563 RepID=J0YUU1_9HYPH|nr:hypothetical protein MCQ_01172 [Bartonella washoeensis Sb944nv]SPU27274.1 Uncharacterised protein [Bartonella washoeensis]